MGDAATIDALRARIRAIEGGGQRSTARRPSGLATLDTLADGLPRPGLVEIAGPTGSGAVRLALELVAAQTRQRRRVAWVDRDRTLHPPAALAQGVDLDRLLIVRPPAVGREGGRHAGTWAAEQLLRSGCFGLVVVTEPLDTEGRPVSEHRFAGVRWRQAAEQGGSTGLFVTRSRALRRALGADLRLGLDGRRLTLLKDRQRPMGAQALLPPWSEQVDPWSPHA
jgi:hypothetical protein